MIRSETERPGARRQHSFRRDISVSPQNESCVLKKGFAYTAVTDKV